MSSKAWGIAAIVAGAGILAYLIWRGKKSASSSGEIPAVAPAPGESITKTIAPGTTQTISAWTSPTGQTGYAQTTTTKESGPAWTEWISYASPSTGEGVPTSGGLGDIIAIRKPPAPGQKAVTPPVEAINLSGRHIYWT